MSNVKVSYITGSDLQDFRLAEKKSKSQTKMTTKEEKNLRTVRNKNQTLKVVIGCFVSESRRLYKVQQNHLVTPPPITNDKLSKTTSGTPCYLQF